MGPQITAARGETTCQHSASHAPIKRLAARCTSSSEVYQPQLRRIAPRATSAESPIALSVDDRDVVPLWHAAPVAAHSSGIRANSFRSDDPGKVHAQCVRQSFSTSSVGPLNECPISSLRHRNNRSLNFASRSASRSTPFAASVAAAPRATR